MTQQDSSIINVLDHGYVKLLNLAGPTRRPDALYDADDVDPANTARTSFDSANQDRTMVEEIKLLGYLYNNEHMTPFEMIDGWFEMKMPIFVARQFVRHRTASINEVSGRYVKLDSDFYIPEPEQVGVKSSSNKQGRDRDTFSPKDIARAADFTDRLKTHCYATYKSYEWDLDNGIPPELARVQLPLNIYTKWVWKMDLRNLMHMMRLRLDSHAQYEAQQYAQAVYDLLEPQLPELMKLFRQILKCEQ